MTPLVAAHRTRLFTALKLGLNATNAGGELDAEKERLTAAFEHALTANEGIIVEIEPVDRAPGGLEAFLLCTEVHP